MNNAHFSDVGGKEGSVGPAERSAKEMQGSRDWSRCRPWCRNELSFDGKNRDIK